MAASTSNRPERVGALVREEISNLLQRGTLKDPRIKMASISDVKMSKDLMSAKVYVQVIGSEEDRIATIKGMQSAVGYIKKELRDRLSLRKVPELTFIADDSAEKADKVLGLLAGIARDRDAKQYEEPTKSDDDEGDEASAGDDDDE